MNLPAPKISRLGRIRAQSGASLVEFAIVAPVLILLIGLVIILSLLVIDLARAMDAAYEAVAYAPKTDITNPTNSKAQIETRATDVLSEKGGCLGCANIAANAAIDSPNNEVVVTVSFDYVLLPFNILNIAPFNVEISQVGYYP